MRKRFGFSLIEIVISLGLFSIVLTVVLKLNAWVHARSQIVLEEQNLMAYETALEWTLKNEEDLKDSVWSGFQDPKDHRRKFVCNVQEGSVCFAKVMKAKEGLYRVSLRSTNSKKIKPIVFFIAKNF